MGLFAISRVVSHCEQMTVDDDDELMLMREGEVDEWRSAARLQQHLLERLAELNVENGVNERI